MVKDEPEMIEDSESAAKTARVIYPASQEYTVNAIQAAFRHVLPDWTVCTAKDDVGTSANAFSLQFCDYDELDWDRADNKTVLTNAYMLRKALIRKNYLCTTVAHWVAKHPDSCLMKTVPKTFPFELAHADELDELFYDELWELGQYLDSNEAGTNNTWWILKPAMADKGQGIRLFNSRESLQAIFNDFDESEDEDSEQGDINIDARSPEYPHHQQESTRIRLNDMRDWIIQEYLHNPLLLDPLVPLSHPELGRKFHLRVYVVAVGALQVYMYAPMLALFASKPYASPMASSERKDVVNDLTAHLTNTCLQSDTEAESSVFLLSDLVGYRMVTSTNSECGDGKPLYLTKALVDDAVVSIGNTVGEIFRAGLAVPNHFSVAANSFEIFGIDFLLAEPNSQDDPLRVHLLEINACPDFKQSGSRLHKTIQNMFEGVLQLAVLPFFDIQGVLRSKSEAWLTGQQRGDWIKCSEETSLAKDRPW